MFYIKDSGFDYRIKKEKIGCSIRGKNKYVEGNDSVYLILEQFKDKKASEVIDYFVVEYDYKREDILTIIYDLFKDFNEHSLFSGIYQDLCKLLND